MYQKSCYVDQLVRARQRSHASNSRETTQLCATSNHLRLIVGHGLCTTVPETVLLPTILE